MTISTPLGDFDILLLEDEAPVTVENFLGYVNRGDYTGTFIHRSVPGFVIQGGGYIYNPSNQSAPHIPTQPPIVNEFGRSNIRGTVAMAKLGGDPDSATSEWFVNLADNSANLDNQNGGFTVFGIVINDGMDVVDQIAALPRTNFGGAFSDTPTINFNGQLRADIFVTLDALTVSMPSDSDGDGVNDEADTDDDNDGVPDVEDVFPYNPGESADLDADGVGDNADTDDDNDGVSDDADAFPSDAGEWADSDGDGTGDNADPDNQSAATAWLFTNSVSPNVTVLHIINSSPGPQRFRGTLYNRDGEQLGSANLSLDETVIASQGRQLLTASDLEAIFNVAPWTGPAVLEVTGTAGFELMTKLTSPSGLVSNTNCVREDRVHNIEGFDSSNMTYVRLFNTSDAALSAIRGSLIDANGQFIGQPLVELLSSMDPKQAVFVNREELAEKFGAQWNGVASLKLESPPEALKLLNLNLVNNETFFNFSCFEGSDSNSIYLMTNSGSQNISETHIVNTGEEAVPLTGTVYAGSGDQLGTPASSLLVGLVEPDGRVILSATDLELLTGAQPWSGPALVEVQGGESLALMTRLTSPSGLVSNTNCVRQGSVHNIEGTDSDNMTFVRFINQGDQAITGVTGRLYDLAGNQLGDAVQLISSLGPKAAVFLNRNDLRELFAVNWTGEATLVVSAMNDDALRLLNLNFVNGETFFNFSCYESSR